jgi:uncharacterized membrane protein
MKPTYLLLRVAKLFSLFGFIVCLFIAYYYLPENVATHFNKGGFADEYMKKGTFFYVAGIFVLIFNITLSLLGRFLSSIPNSMMKVPNSRYWLADKESREALNDILRNWLNSLTALVNILLIFCLFLILMYSMNKIGSIEEFSWMLFISFIVLMGWTFFLPVRLFFRPKKTALE